MRSVKEKVTYNVANQLRLEFHNHVSFATEGYVFFKVEHKVKASIIGVVGLIFDEISEKHMFDYVWADLRATVWYQVKGKVIEHVAKQTRVRVWEQVWFPVGRLIWDELDEISYQQVKECAQ